MNYASLTLEQQNIDISYSKERPFSRQGSAVGERPFTSRPMTGRVGSAMGRPGSGRVIPGTWQLAITFSTNRNTSLIQEQPVGW